MLGGENKKNWNHHPGGFQKSHPQGDFFPRLCNPQLNQLNSENLVRCPAHGFDTSLGTRSEWNRLNKTIGSKKTLPGPAITVLFPINLNKGWPIVRSFRDLLSFGFNMQKSHDCSSNTPCSEKWAKQLNTYSPYIFIFGGDKLKRLLGG